MLDTLSSYFETSGFMPHGHCFLWTPSLLWSYVIADSIIAASYYSIPVALWYFVQKRRDLPFRWIFVMFGVFVMACGTTHIFAIWNIWLPNYWADAGMKVFTASASVMTAILLWPLIPQALAIPSPELLRRANQGLQNEVSRRIQAENELRKANSALEQRTAQLEAANKELDAFSYSVAHDLRAPLRRIGAFSQFLQEDLKSPHGLDTTDAHYFDVIIQSVSKMGKLVDDLLTLAHTDRLKINQQAVDLNGIIAAARKECEPLGGEDAEWQISSLPTVRGDAALLQVVFTNLLSNAVKFSRGRVPPIIEIKSLTGDGDEMIVVVKDNGAGFDPSLEYKLFGVFQRLHRDDEFEGNGVGLATVQRIIHRLDGRVWAEGKLDQGAIFFVALRRA
ncbi:sensor histidine kinase [Collimonas silvisoli]|uniref:sensor histidine kinase n=1 Tax=Collimonas silvisoli TaxID=2825884 RepID=UPI001B8AFAD7|nr:ATP-binding protein [Collimonas silvisoli]